jgi:hypothetical protein
MTSLQLNYFVARERELQLALRAERVRQSRTATLAEARSPLGRLLSGLFARSDLDEWVVGAASSSDRRRCWAG